MSISTNTEYTFREATEKDNLGLIASVVNRANQKITYRNPEVARTSETDIAKSIQERQLFVAVDQKNVVCGTVTLSPDLTNKNCYRMGMLATDPDHQGQRVASRLLEYVESQAKKVDAVCLQLSIFSIEDPRLSKFYESNGYKFNGNKKLVREQYIKEIAKSEYHNTPVYSIQMEKTL